MRQSWDRSTPWLNLDIDSLTELIQPVFKGCRVISAHATQGGLANTNYRLELSNVTSPILLRIFSRKNGTARKEFAINQLVKSCVRVPEYFYFADSNSITGHPYALMEWIDGYMLDSVIQSANIEDIGKIAGSVGCVLANIHSFRFEQAGFFNNELEVVQPLNMGSEGFLGFVYNNLINGNGHKHLGDELTQQFWNFCNTYAYLLDDIDFSSKAPCLVHSDFGGTNILLKRSIDSWTIGGVIDWEFAYSGLCMADVGHILRPPLDSLPEWEEYFIKGYIANGGLIPSQWKRISKLLDLLAWVDFLNRDVTSTVISSAKQVLINTMNGW
ncbi:MAG: aminoglycoside phosphotransferase family protein [Calothrix sp. FI2-JRJ7]|jgi:aminoglycoside phosphotransferase (APT) family kinase protein|nr:aminoglycoside phosphotransferase family protein [Calothrix sp. FI2-JRJ7]